MSLMRILKIAVLGFQVLTMTQLAYAACEFSCDVFGRDELHMAIAGGKCSNAIELINKSDSLIIEYLFLAIDRNGYDGHRLAENTEIVKCLIKKYKKIGIDIDTKIERIDSL